MAREFKGKIEVDIRDSVPDWAPYLPPKAPEGAPNVLFLAWDDVGYGTMDVFGGPVETPNMRRIADMGVRFSNFHTTALCSPTRSSLLTGRNATSNGMATIAEFSSGLPRHLDPHPVRERVHLRGARRARLQHLLRRQVAPHAGRGVQPRRVQGPLAARARVRALLRLPRRRDQPVVSGPRPRQPPDRAPGDARRRATTSRRTSPTRRSSSSATPRSSIPTSRSSCTSRRRRGHAPHHVSAGVGRQVQGHASTRATRRSAPEILDRQKELGLLPAGHRAVADQPARRAERPVPTASRGRCSTPSGPGTR